MAEPSGFMTYETFMNRPDRLKRKIEHKADEVAFKMEVCMKTTVGFGERVQSSRRNTADAAVLAYIDAREELDALLREREEAVKLVQDFLYGNLEYEDADILEWRYVNGRELQEIADMLGVAYQTVKNRISAAEKRARAKFGTEKY